MGRGSLSRMRKKFMRLHPVWRLYCMIFIILILYNEFFIYILQKFKWSNIYCKEGNCLRMLLVGDPQILGKSFDKHFYAGLANYDSDRYLAWYYEKAVEHVRPDVICFLGDLMDEGNTSNEADFKDYYERFGAIFPTHPSAKTIYIPGDNDIGGEAGEEVLPSIVRRFRQYFSEKPAWVVNENVTIYNINKITHERPGHDPRLEGSETQEDVADRYIRIFLSHMPVLTSASSFIYDAIGKLKPNVIFSGHLHSSRYVRIHRKHLRAATYMPLSGDKKTLYKVHSFDLNYHQDTQELLEIVIPTCSYRMGVPDIGYGFAVIDGTNLKYTVLWTTQRFHQLISYVVVLSVPLIYFALLITIRILRAVCVCSKNKHSKLPI
ncbi:metallophosphoesterase 1 homolog [Uranotaenia lowii]|uniref:metallophosphoesterase 1 homolog n=1 Tax=Uranotaenia lowii TaxID=190385 RepID=UPI00247906F7|nr:metallophosphoesterase 1 homolog [Uranotaenia lowii]